MWSSSAGAVDSLPTDRCCIQSDGERLLALACGEETLGRRASQLSVLMERVPQVILPPWEYSEILTSYLCCRAFVNSLTLSYVLIKCTWPPFYLFPHQLHALQDVESLFTFLDFSFFRNVWYIIFQIFISSESL